MPAKVPTIGYGTTNGLTRSDVGKKTITQADAERLLADDVKRFEQAADRLVKAKLSDNQRGALVSWTYNLGEGKSRCFDLAQVHQRRQAHR
ncbi:lysozyme [Rhizobium populisoli]|uniref:lysozyme n=1 Tax=Rhizobium populisoli TaxID=2859785 RepID=UPI001FE6100D|nr:lysozyme [Rhizobium populisoli]